MSAASSSSSAASSSSSAAPSASASLSPGQSPPLFTVTPTDKAGVIVIITAFCLALAVVATLVRAYVRFRITAQRLAWDDGLIGVAVLLYIAQAVLVFEEVHNGFGKAISDVKPNNIFDIQKLLYSDGFFYILTIWTSKVSATFLYLRLSRKRNHRSMSFAILGLLGLTAFISILIVALRCNLSRPWMYFNSTGTTCSALINRWQVVAAFDILTEVILAAAAVYLVYALQMDRSKKSAVIFAFNLRLVVLVPIALRLHYFSAAYNTNDPTLRATNLTIVTQVQIVCAIVVASIPTLRPFMVATATHYGAPAEGAMSHAVSGPNHTSSGGSFGLRNLAAKIRNTASNKGTQNSRSSVRDDFQKEGPSLPGDDDYITHTNVFGGQSHNEISRGSDDSSEAIIRKNGIRKDVGYTVEYGDQP